MNIGAVSDIGKNLDINPSFGVNKGSGINPAKKIESETSSNPAIDNSQTFIENKSVYKNPSISQVQLGFETQERLGSNLPILNSKNSQTSITPKKLDELSKEQLIIHKNPIFGAQMQNPKTQIFNKKKSKKTPPEPSLQVQFNPKKGTAINPRKVKPAIPGRLQSLIDDGQKPIEKLMEALDPEEYLDLNLANIYAKKIMSSGKNINHISASEYLNLDEDFIELTRNNFILQLKEFLDEHPQDLELANLIIPILQGLESHPNPNMLMYLAQFFLPVPCPYNFEEIDREFLEDEDELINEFEEKKKKNKKSKKNKDENEDSEQEEDVNHPDCVCSMSIKTFNYNKIHFLIKQNTNTNHVKVLIKGDASASEIIIPIESEIEDILFDSVNSINYDVSTWKESVLRITEKKILKTKLTGNINPIMLKICNSILRGINNNDSYNFNQQYNVENDSRFDIF